MEVPNGIIWWVGAAVLGTGGSLAAAALISFAACAAAYVAWAGLVRSGRILADLHNMRAWVRAGKPTWYSEDGKPTQMRPAVARMPD